MPFNLYIIVTQTLLALCFILACAPQSTDAPEHPKQPERHSWLQWRGPLGTGAAPAANPPLTWSEGENVRWKAALPGLGQSSPLVLGELVFVTSAEPIGEPLKLNRPPANGAHDNLRVDHVQRFLALAFGRRSGRELWRTTLVEALPHAPVHKSGSFASASPVSDGERIFAYFGSNGLYALNLKGELLWQANLGHKRVKHDHGEGSSPALYGDTLVVNWDHEGQSSLVAFDTESGEVRWRNSRDEPTSWSTPIIAQQDGKPLVMVSATGAIRAHDLKTGKLVWECSGMSNNVVATPVAGLDMFFAGSSYEKQAMLAIRLPGAHGDLAQGERKHIAWYKRRRTPYVPSLLLSGEWLYYLQHYQGLLSRVDAQTGAEPERPLKLPGIRDVYASPVAAAGRIYVVDRSGETVVISEGEGAHILARNRLDDSFSASPAVVDDEFFLRGDHWLYCLGLPEEN